MDYIVCFVFLKVLAFFCGGWPEKLRSGPREHCGRAAALAGRLWLAGSGWPALTGWLALVGWLDAISL